MAHLLIIELPGGNDTDLLEAALREGHRYTFVTSDLFLYTSQPAVRPWIERATNVVHVPGFDLSTVLHEIDAVQARERIDAVLCLIDIRLIEAARVAEHLRCAHLRAEQASLVRDKYQVRRRLAAAGLRQPDFELATTNRQAREAVERLGLPVLIKPADGYGSQNILTLRTSDDLLPWLSPFDHLLPTRADYGLGVKANDRLLIERYMSGRFVGCDTFTLQGQHHLLGVHDKLMVEPPSFAILGGCFSQPGPEHEHLRDYVFKVLDAVGFDCGAAHVEVMLTSDGPQLVELNPRLVGAKIPRLLNLTLQRDVHADLIRLHLGQLDAQSLAASPGQRRWGVTRWIMAESAGHLDRIDLPDAHACGVDRVEILRKPGDWVQPPFENADRLGYVMTSADTRQAAQEQAQRFVQHSRVHLRSAPPQPQSLQGEVGIEQLG